MLIDNIKREHGYMLQLFILLEHKCQRLQEDKCIDYSIIYDVLWYLQNHSETIHHPKEDVIYQYYIDKYGSQNDLINLIEEHQVLNKTTSDFADLVEMVLQDAIIPKEVFIQKLHDFIREQREHLAIEEDTVFPQLMNDFTQEDLDNIETLWGENAQDPLFGSHVTREYYRLADRLAEDIADYTLEKECHRED